MTDDLRFTSAARMAKLVRTKAVSVPDVISAALTAARAAQASLNPFVAILEERALEDARRAERMVMDGAELGPLHGVPISVKDNIDVGGVPTRHGSALTPDTDAKRDNVLVARLRAAGAIVFAKSHMPEFGHKGLTDGPSFGVTRNPWDLDRTAGGSSGGGACAVAAGLGPLALGTDGGGSIRIPAACCGVVGLKATLGSVPMAHAADGFGNYSYAGPIARTITDTDLLRSVLIGPDPADPLTVGRAPERQISAGLPGNDLAGVRVGMMVKMGNAKVQKEVEDNFTEVANLLTSMGADAEPIERQPEWIEAEGSLLFSGNYAATLGKYLPHGAGRMDLGLVAMIERGGQASLKQFREAQFARTRLFRDVQALFDRFDVLLTPTFSRTALPATFNPAEDEVEIDGERLGTTRRGWIGYLYPFNLTGHPALTVPSGFDDDGLPTAVQIVGRWGSDVDLLRIGGVIEQARPWAGARPARRP